MTADVEPPPPVIGIGAVGPCILWTGYLNPKGYGQRKVGGRVVLAHRQAWTEAYGHPGESQVCHRCDNPACINVEHLFLGTNADNVADKVAKGRQSRLTGLKGERHPKAKLTDEQVREIRASTGTNFAIAHRFGVSRPTVSLIRSGKQWAHIQ